MHMILVHGVIGFDLDGSYFDMDHPIMEEFSDDNNIDIYEFNTTYLPHSNNVEVIFSLSLLIHMTMTMSLWQNLDVEELRFLVQPSMVGMRTKP